MLTVLVHMPFHRFCPCPVCSCNISCMSSIDLIMEDRSQCVTCCIGAACWPC